MRELLQRLGGLSIRRRLTLAFVLVFTVLTALFVYSLVERQSHFLQQQSLKQAQAISHALAVASKPWLLANDIVGMEEVVEAVSDYPELHYAMLINTRGRVLAHTDPERVGRYLTDTVSRQMLSATVEPRILVSNSMLIDTITPVITDGRLIGWARIGFGQEGNRKSLEAVIRDGLFYTLLAMIVGTLVAVILARSLSSGLERLLRSANKVSAGERNVPLEVDRRDEIGQLAAGLERMRDSLVGSERMLAESEARYRLIADNIHDVIFIYDLQRNKFTYVSPSIQHRRGYTAEEAMEQSIEQAVTPDSYPVIRQKLQERVEAFMRGDHSLDAEEIIIRQPCRDGSVITSALVGTILPDAAGHPKEVVGVTRDISERLEAEEQLRAANRLLDSVIENIPNMLFLKDATELRFVRLNRATEEMLGLKPKEMLGKSDRDFFPEEQAEFFIAKDREVLASHKVLDIPQEKVQNTSGETRLLHTKKLALRNEKGEPQYLLGISEDITERIHAEQELERYRNHLEQLVRERTRDLELAKKAAEAASQAKSTFLANMSHELRTPLNAILGFSQILLRDEEIGSRHEKELSTINRAGHHLLGLINDVLELSRIEAGRATIHNHPFDLEEVLRAASDMTRLRAEEKGLDFILERPEDIPCFVVGDEHLLRQVLINLLSNAAKYTEQGFVCLRVSRLEGERIQFCVEDSGLGISIEEQKHLFESFYQTESGRSKGEGTGLGLPISQEYVHLMGGELTVTSEPGTGSKFCFDIALPLSEAPASKVRHRRVIGLENDEHRRRIMVVEDDEDSRQLLSTLLEDAGFDVLALANGREAVEHFSQWQPRMVWMDMRMPVMDGYEATRRIRELPGGDRVKIAALTASAFAEERPRILAAGCDEMLSKPLDEVEMFAVMGRLLGVKYIFAAEDSAEVQAPPPQLAPDVAGLQASLVQELADAARGLDVEQANAVIERIVAINPVLAKQLQELLHNYRFDQILKITARADHEGDK